MSESATMPWWQTGVIYQIYPRSFQDSTGDGVGDLRGVTQRLDYLSNVLGVDAIWLSPFYPSPMADFGYDVADHCDVDPLFGSLEDFDELVTGAHARGIRVVVDFVANHTSVQHPWFQESRASTDNPKRDWYVWVDPGPDGEPPNNWLSVFGGKAWTLDAATGQYFLHSFLSDQPDLNWRNPEVETAMLDVLRFWLDRGVDGFRIDGAHHVMKDPELRDNPPQPRAGPSTHKALGEYDTQIHVHDGGHEDLHRVFRRIREVVDGYPERGERVAIGEIYVFDLDRWASYYGERLDELHMPFNFTLLAAPWSAKGLRDAVERVERAVPEGAWPNYVLGNHDELRITERYGPAAARLAAVLLLTLRGTPTLYYGDELLLPQASIPDHRQQDPYGRRVPGLGRDGCRTPMAWNAAENAGFTTASHPWLPLHADHRDRNVASQLEDPASPLTLVRRMLALRRDTPALRAGAYRALDAPEDCFVYTRSLGSDRWLIALNLGTSERTVTLPRAGRIRLSTHADGEPDGPRTGIVLRPDEGVVVRLDVG